MAVDQRTHLRRRMLKLLTPFMVAALCLGITGCGTRGITASTLCRDYLNNYTQSERWDAAVRLSVSLGANTPGSPFWGPNIDLGCGQNLDRPVGDLF